MNKSHNPFGISTGERFPVDALIGIGKGFLMLLVYIMWHSVPYNVFLSVKLWQSSLNLNWRVSNASYLKHIKDPLNQWEVCLTQTKLRFPRSQSSSTAVSTYRNHRVTICVPASQVIMVAYLCGVFTFFFSFGPFLQLLVSSIFLSFCSMQPLCSESQMHVKWPQKNYLG